ncbi:MGMT family protein [Acinetobacter sp.]|uniref:MGMT family protein n=1 Tax=Acinetobacter sp. TaxID=472 RepID=UPI00388E027C
MPPHLSRSSDELARQILQVVVLIPYGKVASYGQIAKLAGLSKHARLVGYILKHLEAETEIPWHRVINSQGKISLSRLDNRGDNLQRLKLMKEGVRVIGDKINLRQYQWMNDSSQD